MKKLVICLCIMIVSFACNRESNPIPSVKKGAKTLGTSSNSHTDTLLYYLGVTDVTSISDSIYRVRTTSTNREEMYVSVVSESSLVVKSTDSDTLYELVDNGSGNYIENVYSSVARYNSNAIDYSVVKLGTGVDAYSTQLNSANQEYIAVLGSFLIENDHTYDPIPTPPTVNDVVSGTGTSIAAVLAHCAARATASCAPGVAIHEGFEAEPNSSSPGFRGALLFHCADVDPK